MKIPQSNPVFPWPSFPDLISPEMTSNEAFDVISVRYLHHNPRIMMLKWRLHIVFPFIISIPASSPFVGLFTTLICLSLAKRENVLSVPSSTFQCNRYQTTIGLLKKRVQKSKLVNVSRGNVYTKSACARTSVDLRRAIGTHTSA